MKILLPPTLLAALLALPAAAQQLDQQPAAGSRPPPTRMEGDRAGPPTAPTQPPAQPPIGTGAPRNEPARTTPPPGHATMPAPSVPNQRQPERSEGASQAGQSPIGPRPGARPDASTTRAQEGPQRR